MPKFRDIPQFVETTYEIDVGWVYLENQLNSYRKTGLDLNPDFQRAHVWTEKKQEKYIEFILKNGVGGRDIYFNSPDNSIFSNIVLVDGKQRIEAVRKFMRNELKAFGCYFREYEDTLNLMVCRFRFKIGGLKTRKEVLRWYVDLNTGGVVHTNAEIEKVKKLLEKETGQ